MGACEADGTFETLDPGNGRMLARVAAAEAGDVYDAVGAARNAFRHSGWASMAPSDRAVILHRIADLMISTRLLSRKLNHLM